MKVWRILAGAVVLTIVAATAAYFYLSAERPRLNVLVPDGSASFAVMDFTKPIPTDPPPDGWFHRTFKRHGPMDISFVSKDDRPSIRLATNDTASILMRQVDIPVDTYRFLSWQWLIEQPVESDLDERTVEGDDHPARLYLRFEDKDGKSRAMEIIWGNRHLKKGDWKHLTFMYFITFPHYTANGGAENAGRWHNERVNLADLYTHLWGPPAGAKLIEIGFFSDTDETGASSIAYFSDLRVEKQEADK